MGTEIKKVENSRYKIGKERGNYSGEAVSGVIGNVPEGYGRFDLKSGGYLEGRFKNGAFVSGKAVSNMGAVFEGEFNDLIWLKGTITYPNGDYIKGGISPKTNKLEIDEFRVTQEFDDVIIGKFYGEENGKVLYKGVQKFVDGSTLSGTFSSAPADSQSSKQFEKDFCETTAFGITRQVFTCEKAIADIKILHSNNTTATLKGTYQHGQIEGTYEFVGEKFKKKSVGTFDFTRNTLSFNQITEDFEGFYASEPVKTPYNYCLNLTKGSMTIQKADGSSFEGNKDASTPNIYSGTYKNLGETLIFTGNFDENLNATNGKLTIKPNKLLNANFHGTINVKNQVGNEQIFNATLNGTFTYANNDFKKGDFTTKITPLFDGNLLQNIASNTKFTSGEFRHTLSPQETFKGKTINLVTPYTEYAYPNSSNVAYFGELSTVKFDKNTKKDCLKSGLFDAKFNHVVGEIFDTFKLANRDVNFVGKKLYNPKNNEFEQIGKLTFLDNSDYFEGDFDAEFNFVKGNLRETQENLSIFIGSTENLTDYNGKMERKNDYWQEGEFIKENGELVFMRGKTLVYFDRADKATCFAKYDCNGFADFDDKKYICNIKSATSRDNPDIIASNSISEAMAEFDKKIQLETENSPHSHTDIEALINKAVEEAISKTQKEIMEKYEAKARESEQRIEQYSHQILQYKDKIANFEKEIADLKTENAELKQQAKF